MISEDDRFSTKIALCFTESAEPWNDVGYQSKVTVRGVHGLNGALYHCRFTMVEGEPCPKITTEELANQYNADPAAAKAAFHEKFVVVTGKLASDVAETQARSLGAAFDVPGDVPVKIDNDGPNRMYVLKNLKAGDTVTILGQCHVSPSDEHFKVGIKRACAINSPAK